MTDSEKPVPGLRSLLEDTLGLRIDDQLKQRLERKLGTTLDDDPARWEEINRTFAIQAGEDPDAGKVVTAVVDRLTAEVGAGHEPPPAWTPAEMAVYATVRIESAVEEGGFDNIAGTGATDWLPHAIAGYRLLGMEGHARTAAALADGLAAGMSDDEREDLEETWFGEIGSDQERATWIQAHPEAFRA